MKRKPNKCNFNTTNSFIWKKKKKHVGLSKAITLELSKDWHAFFYVILIPPPLAFLNMDLGNKIKYIKYIDSSIQYDHREIFNANLLITWLSNLQRRWYFSKKAENQVWEVWHNKNLSQGTNTIGIETNDTTRSALISQIWYLSQQR